MKKVKVLILVIAIAALVSFLFNYLFVGKLKEIGAPKIAVVKVYGVIKSPDGYLRTLNSLEKDPRVKAIILRVDSPGGVVGACQEIYEKIKEVKKVKPVVVSMGSVAASGGLYVSVPATKIVANPGTITGSIGVILQSYNLKELAQKLGVKVITVKSGKFKDLLNPFREPTKDEIKVVQDLIDDTYEQFVEAVAKGRNLPLEKVKSFADGRIFTGREAKKLGLVDYLGGLDKAVEVARKLSKSPNARVWIVKERVGIIERIIGKESSQLLGKLIGVVNGDVEEVKLMYLLN
ncbi:signal peptide peptidase SppA [Thermovibrio sp.]